ncbi:MAG: TonB family protein [Syntrophorhabdales bacterium]|jgi:TonB family protein
MREENWYKMLVASAILHVFIIGALSIPLRKAFKKADFSYYSVNLVGDISAGREVPKAAPAPPVKAALPEAPKKVETKKPPPKERVVSTTKERSLAPKKKDVPRTVSKDEVRTLDQRIRELRSRTQYMDVSGKKEGAPAKAPGIPGSGTPSGPFDPVLQKYYADVWEKIQESWHSPNLSVTKGLLTVVSIKIRKDGRITDWTIEQRSGNRAYDESIARALRSIDTLPPIPASLRTDLIEVGFNFHPPGEGR